MADDLRDRLARAVAQNDTLGGCQFNDYFCVTHMAYLGPSDLYCTRVTGIADALLLFIRDEVADELHSVADRLTRIVAELLASPEHGRLEPFARFAKWLRSRADEVRNG